MRLRIETILDYDLPQPADILLALEVAAMSDQMLVQHDLDVAGSGPLSSLRGGSAVGRRNWTRANGGRMRACYTALVDVERKAPAIAGLAASPLPSLPEDVLPFIWPSRYCEADRFNSFVCDEFAGLAGGDLVLAMVDWVRQHLNYVPGSSDGNTTAVDCFVARQGVCRDYAHLTAALIRSMDIPARLVSVYALGLNPPDFHAVVEVWLEGAWHIVDATDLAPIEGMARIAAGRDATDIAFMTVFGTAALMVQSVSVARAD